MSALTDALGISSPPPVAAKQSSATPLMQALGVSSQPPAGVSPRGNIEPVANPGVPTQNFQGQQIPSSIATKNLVAYDQATGNKTFSLPSWLGGGVYTEDKNNNLVHSGHTTYGGVPSQTGMQRDDIIPAGLGGTNSNAGNIRLVPSATAAKQDKVETDLSGQVKAGKLQPKAAITEALSQKQQIANPPSLAERVGQFFNTLNPPKDSLVFNVQKNTPANATLLRMENRGNQEQAFRQANNASALTGKNLADTAQATTRAVAALTISGYQMFQDRAENQINLQNTIAGKPPIPHTELSNTVEPVTMSKTSQFLLGTDTIKDLPGQAADLEVQLNQAGITGPTASILASLGISASTVAALSPVLGLDELGTAANRAVNTLSANFTKDTGLTITRDEMLAISKGDPAHIVSPEVTQAWSSYVNKAAAAKLAVKTGTTEITTGTQDTPLSSFLRNASSKDIFGRDAANPVANPNVKPAPQEVPTEQYANPGVAQNLALQNEPVKVPVAESSKPTALTLAMPGGEKYYVKLTPEQKAQLFNEPASIPSAVGTNQPQVHLDPFNSKLTAGAKEITLQEFSQLTPHAQTVAAKIQPQVLTQKENSQAGFVSPSAIAESAKGNITSAKDLIARTKTGMAASADLEDSLFNIKQAGKADKLQAAELLKNSPMTNQDAEAIYHYQENKAEILTPKQQDLYNTEIKPLADESARIVAKLKPLIPINEENYTPRMVKGKGNLLDRLAEKGKAVKGGMGSQLSKAAPSLQKRTMKALVDDKGNRIVVSIKNGVVTKFENGQQTILGNEKLPVTTKQKEFYDKVVMEKLNKLAHDLGIKHQRLDKALRGNLAGKSLTGQGKIVTGFATPEDVLLHEIGHQIDEQYGLGKGFATPNWLMDEADVKIIKQEMRKLADARAADQNITPNYAKYLRKEGEKIAVMFQSYLHAPELFKEIAPKAYDKFVELLKSEPRLTPILDIKPTLVLGFRSVGGNPNVPGMFVDRTGKSYKITEATTKEIEANTDLTYHHNALVNNTINYLKLRQAERAVDFLEAYKESPEFKQIAVKFGEGLAPDGWRPSSLRTFSGYVFEPHVAAVLDEFNKSLISGADPLKILTAINSFLRTSIFFNPLIHVPNIANHWFVTRGVTPFANPKAYGRLVSTSVRAINAVLRQNTDYVDMLKSGANLLYADENIKNLNDLLLQKMSQNIETDPQLKFFRETFPGFIKWLNPYKLSGKITWAVNDIATMQSVYENMENGLTMQEAIAETGKHIPNYRVPANILGSEAVSKFLKNPNITMFSAYHYGALKSYAETAKDLSSGDIKRTGDALNRLAMLALITFVLYPQLDKLAKKITGNTKAQFRRAGASTFLYQSLQLAKGHIDAGQFLTTFLTPAPATKETLQQVFNLDFFTGQNIRTKGQTAMTQLKESGTHAGIQVSPAQQYQRIASGTVSGKEYIASLFGISSSKATDSEKILQSMIYEEKPKLQTELKTLLDKHQDKKAQEIINDFNNRLKQAAIAAYKENGQTVPANLDTIMKPQLLKLPGSKALDNSKKNKGKSPLQKMFP